MAVKITRFDSVRFFIGGLIDPYLHSTEKSVKNNKKYENYEEYLGISLPENERKIFRIVVTFSTIFFYVKLKNVHI